MPTDDVGHSRPTTPPLPAFPDLIGKEITVTRGGRYAVSLTGTLTFAVHAKLFPGIAISLHTSGGSQYLALTDDAPWQISTPGSVTPPR